MRYTEIDWQIWTAGAGALLLAAAGSLYWLGRRTHDPDEAERRRRSRLNQIGRIVEGKVVEIIEAPAAPAQAPRRFGRLRKRSAAGKTPDARCLLVCYSYSISGVTYETAQDITGLEERACPGRVVPGQPASVKYDPANPSNSILISDDWSGLR